MMSTPYLNCMVIQHIAMIESGAKIVITPTKTNYLAAFKSTDTVNIYAELTDLQNL